MHGVRFANATNTFLGAVLTAASDRARALQQLGLPSSRQIAIGSDWFTPGLQQNHPCPEVLEVSRLHLLPLFITDWKPFALPLRPDLT